MPADQDDFRRYWTGHRIDRTFAITSQRLMIGLHIARDWSGASGSLVVAGGRGKFLRLLHAVEDRETLDPGLRQRLAEASAAVRGDGAVPLQRGGELAEHLAPLADRLASAAGRYVDRVLAVAVDDPGYWRSDFDGLPVRAPAVDPNRLAELTGLSVIDDFPAKDLSAGGNGRWLEALPLWFLFADRSPQEATGSTILLMAGDEAAWYFLPGSDGLDETVPEIVTGAIDPSASGCPGSGNKHGLDEAGRVRLLELIENPPGGLPVQRILVVPGAEGAMAGLPLLRDAEWLVAHCRTSEANAIRLETVPEPDRVLRGRCAALLGLMFTDQMPQNVPPLTGASGMRLLGRLVPGKPFSFRNLVAAMADGQSSPMRLRDAVQAR